MITVSNEWKELHNQRFLPESFVEISLRVSDDTVTQQHRYTYWHYSNFGEPGAIVHIEEVRPPMYYATLEENLWILDGSRQIVPDIHTGDNPGYVSWKNQIWSDETSSGVRYQISFNNVRTVVTPGLTITWSSEYDEYPTTFMVETLNGDVVVDSITVTGNKSKTSTIDRDFVGYDVLRITPLDWNVPNHRLRIDQIYFGQTLVFDKANILSYSHEQTGDPLGGELSKNSISFDIDNVDGRWDLLNPQGITQYLAERQLLTVRYGFQTRSGIEWITAGTFYLTEWKVSEDGMKISFSARDILEFLMNTTYSRKNVPWTVTEKCTIYPTINDMYLDAVDFNLDGNGGATMGEFSAGETVMASDICDYYFYFETGSMGGVTGVLTEKGWVHNDFGGFGNGVYSMLDRVREAFSAAGLSDSQWIFDVDQTANAPIFIPDTPVANFIQTCANKFAYAIWQSAEGKLRVMRPSSELTDYKIREDVELVQPSIELAKPLKEIKLVLHPRVKTSSDVVSPYAKSEEITSVSSTGDTITIDNPYVWDVFDSKIRTQMIEAYKQWWNHRGILKGEFRADPRLELFDVISVDTKYGLVNPVMITYIKYTYNGSFHGTFEGKILSKEAT